jgi:hypothetical protein
MKSNTSRTPKALLIATLVGISAISSQAQINIAPTGTALFGAVPNTTPDATGVVYVDANNGPASHINDGSLTTVADNYYEGANSDGFVGITWTTPLTSTITSLVLYGQYYNNGGWFGISGENSVGATSGNSNGPLVASVLIAPTLQYTLSYTGTSTVWVDLPVEDETNNYVSQNTGASTANGTFDEIPATFTLTTPITGIEGIRLIGSPGGDVGRSGQPNDGFIGVEELEVLATAPEPSTYALMFAGLLALVGMARFTKVRLDA